MNKQELIDYCNAIKENKNQFINCIDVNRIIKRIEQLDEPQKVVVPQFVADWYEEHKDNLEFNIFDYVYQFDQNAGFDFKDWFDDFNTKPIQTLVNMHQFGYEVEEEKRYIVSLKNGQPLVKAPLGGNFYFNQNITAGNCKATRKQLEEAGFGWVFDCEGVEVEEVE